jgi:hypothetical protein
MTPVAVAATAKPPCAPEVSTAQPAIAAAPAEPAALAEFSQAKAWVSTARWAAASARTEHWIRIRGTASPVSATQSPSSAGEPAASSDRQPIASTVAAMASRTRAARRQWRSPYSQPASRLAQLDTVNIAAAMPAAPCSTANAVTEICMAPKNPPMARFTPASTANPGRSSERPAPCCPAVPVAGSVGGGSFDGGSLGGGSLGGGSLGGGPVGGGAVWRCAAKHNPPATTKMAASTVPAAGYPLAPRMLTRTGPVR